MEISLPPSVAEALAAAFLDRRAYHHDLCDGPCSCGAGSLLTDLAELLLPGFTDAAVRLGLEGKPFWPQDHADLLSGRVAASA